MVVVSMDGLLHSCVNENLNFLFSNSKTINNKKRRTRVSLWKNTQTAQSTPKYISASYVAANDVANTIAGQVFVTSENTGPTRGWILNTKGSGGKSGRTQKEILVAAKLI